MNSPVLPRLNAYSNGQFIRGRSLVTEGLWLFVQWLLISSWIPGAAHRRWLLRIFGAEIGERVNIKPGVRIKFPWRLSIGNHSWIGEDVWIDNLAQVTIGPDCCISQGSYFCTGDHDWSRQTFDLSVRPIRVEAGAWVAARSVVGPGVVIGEGAVLGLASVATKNLKPWTVYQGAPAVPVGARVIARETQSPLDSLVHHAGDGRSEAGH